MAFAPPGSGSPVKGTARESVSTTVRRLSAAQKSAKGAPAYSRFVNRRLGRYLAAIAFRMGLTPNTVTAISAVFSFAGISLLFLVQPAWWLGVLVTACLVLGYALDSADGQLARLRGGGSVAGEWLDHMIDATKIASLHMGVLIYLYRFAVPQSSALLLVPIGFAVVASVSFFGMILNEQLQKVYALRSGVPVGNVSAKPSTLRSLLVLPTDYGVLCLVFLLLGWPIAFFAAYAVLFAGSLGYLALAVFKWFGVMKSLDAHGSAAAMAGESR